MTGCTNEGGGHERRKVEKCGEAIKNEQTTASRDVVLVVVAVALRTEDLRRGGRVVAIVLGGATTSRAAWLTYKHANVLVHPIGLVALLMGDVYAGRVGEGRVQEHVAFVLLAENHHKPLDQVGEFAIASTRKKADEERDEDGLDGRQRLAGSSLELGGKQRRVVCRVKRDFDEARHCRQDDLSLQLRRFSTLGHFLNVPKERGEATRNQDTD